MVIKSYNDVSPSKYEGLSDGVQIREMITAQDGAPTFAMRVFDVTPGAATPYHTHAWEHEVYIVSGTGRIRIAKERSYRSSLVIQSTSLRTSNTALWQILVFRSG